MPLEIQAKIQELIDKYLTASRAGEIQHYTEEETKKDFILPLFGLLGWNIHDKKEVSAEEHIKSSGRVDYGFYLNGRIKFYLEAKPLKADLNREDYANQAVRYAWNRGAAWAVLTDFESIKVFNAQDIERSLGDKLYFEIPFDQYLERFHQLWLLSKESFEKDLLDKEAEKIGKKFQKIPISELLYKDLNKCRELLTKSLSAWNPKVNKELLDEGVQKILDRLIFLRVAEDRKLEPPTLIPLVRVWEASKDKNKVPIYKSMVSKFRELDDIYNSNLFTRHPFEDWEEYDGSTEKVIEILYGKKGYYEYDFKAMPADILGSVYENYLGYKLAQSKKGVALDKSAKKRKEQGIYYTPSFIVDYIVKNALKPVLDKCKTIDDLKKIKVLDPACGSGSFLIKALELIADKYEDLGRSSGFLTKVQILTENIYGVDLDPQAVEIAQLNLLISALDQRRKLPSLAKNIKNGNSLISGTDEELKKYFGKDYRDKKPFNWQEEFPEVFKQGGFDVVIGNPPYIDSEEMTKTQKDLRDYCVGKYKTAKGNWDLFCIFLEKGLNLLKEDGRLGMIIPNKLISAKYADAIRDLLSFNTVLIISDYSTIAVFGANVYPVVVVIKKGKNEKDKLEVVVNQGTDFPISSTSRIFSQEILNEYKNSWAPLFEQRSNLDFLNRIVNKFPKLGDLEIFNVTGAATVSEAYEIKKIIQEINSNGEVNKFRFINTGTIDRYRSLWATESTRYIKGSYLKPIILKEEFEKFSIKRCAQASSKKIIIGGMSKVIECFLDEQGQYIPGKSTTIITAHEASALKSLIAILNSKLISQIYSRIFKSLSLAGGFFRIGAPQLRFLPISLPKELSIQKNLSTLVNKILALNNELDEVSENSSKWESLKSEIEKTDKKIDEEVYKLYDLTSEEIVIIEGLK